MSYNDLLAMTNQPPIMTIDIKKHSTLLFVITFMACAFISYWLIHIAKTPYTTRKLTLPQIESNIDAEEASLDHDWKRIKPKSGESLAILFHHLKLSPQTLQTILNDNPNNKAFSNIKPNQELQFLIQNKRLEKLIIPISPRQSLVISRVGDHYPSSIKALAMQTHQQLMTATIEGSLLRTAAKKNIPNKLIRQMMEIFSREINFAHDIRSGDQFSFLYDALYIEDKQVDVGDIIAVRFTTHLGKSFEAIRHRNTTGRYDYFTQQGKNLKKAFNRYPVKFSHISSTFSLSRMHPILHYNRPHRGIDLAAPIGTPIYAIGDGRIEIIGRQGGYGNMIKIKHDSTYTSVYGHLLKFQKGLRRGSYVKQGQLIGFVGQTGLASGPHCHFEIRVHNRYKNPATISLPNAAPIAGKNMAAFRAKANILLARLKLFEEGNLIASRQPNIDA